MNELLVGREHECSTCRWFDRSLFEGENMGAGPGYCRRFPPVLDVVEGRGNNPVKQAQPVVNGWEWCGEWTETQG